MSRLNVSSSLGEWVAQQPQTARVFEELQLDYCCGGRQSLEQACVAHHLDPAQVLARLDEATASGGGAAGAEDWNTAELSRLCDHIESTHHAYLHGELPRLTSLIEKVVKAHGDRHPELRDVQRVFGALRAEMESHMFKEERVLFPAIRYLEQSVDPVRFPFGSLANPISRMEDEHDSAGTALAELRRLTADYRPPDDACRTFCVLLDALAKLEADMHAHVHKENNILFPRAIRIEASQGQSNEPSTGLSEAGRA